MWRKSFCGRRYPAVSSNAVLRISRAAWIGMEACSGSHHIARQFAALGHDVRLIPAQYAKPFLKGRKNDNRDAEAIAEAVQRPTVNFVAIKPPEQMDLLALHRVRSRLVGQRTGAINQIRGFLIERGITVRQGLVPLRRALPDILNSNTDVLSPRIVSLIADLMQDWRRLDERIAAVSAEIEALARQDDGSRRLMTVPGVGPIISSAVVAASGNGAGSTLPPGSGSCRSRSRRAIARSWQDLQALRHRTAVHEALPNLRNPPIAVKVIPSLTMFRCTC